MIELLLVSPQTEQSNGGIAVWTDVFLKQCNKHNISCDLLNIAMIGSRAKQGNSKRNFFDEFIRTKAIFKNLKYMLESKKYDIAHINTSCGAFGLIRDYITARRIKRCQPNCKMLVHFHCDVQHQAGTGYKRKFLEKLLCLADKIVVLNEYNRVFLQQSFNVECEVVPNFIDEQYVRTSEKIINACIKKALFVGFVQPEKGAEELFKLAKAFPNINFELIGEVRADVQKWEKPNNLFLLGRKNRNDIIDALDESDIFVFPTHSEGFSIALLESMARGLPCITTPAGANVEMIENKGGVIVPIGDVDAMINAIKYMQNPLVRKEMSIWNVEKVYFNYINRQVIENIIELYK